MILPAAGLKGGGQTRDGGVQNPRLVAAAQEFEAQMMKELLGPLGRGAPSLDGSEGNGDSGGILGEYATEALGRALSQHGGLGMATRILNELSPARSESRGKQEKSWGKSERIPLKSE